MDNRARQSITGMILAGGRGTRMGNVDKGLQPFRGRPLIEHVIERIAPQVGALAINANRNLERYQSYQHAVWPDLMNEASGEPNRPAVPAFAGPLAGLCAGLTHCPTELLVIVPCDTPFLPADLVERLYRPMMSAQGEQIDLSFAATGTDQTRQHHPVFCLARKRTLSSLQTFLQNGGRKMESWFQLKHTAIVHFDNEADFANLNTLDDLGQYANE